MIALVGASGFIGQAFARYFVASEVAFAPLSRAHLDYYDSAKLAACLKDCRATFLVNAAGYTGKPNVDACEGHKSECLAANAVLPGVVRHACESLEIPWGHVSSGCIYTGARPGGNGFRESDPPNFTFRHINCSF
jgi:dTDP-4-dehydrorhamnose reductase